MIAHLPLQTREGTRNGLAVRLVLAGLSLLVATSAMAATYSLGITNWAEGPAAGTDTVALTVSPATSAWTASSGAPWLHLAATSGTGSTNVLYSFDANTGATRVGTLTIAGQILTVTQAGSTYVAVNSDTQLVASGLFFPAGVAVDGVGNVYISDSVNYAIKKWNVSNNTVTTLVASGVCSHGIAVDKAGNVYFSDLLDNTLKKWSVADGTLTALVSSGLNAPQNIAVDGAGNVYIADYGNNAVKKWSVANGSVTTLFSQSYAQPCGVAVDGAGNVYFADAYNNYIGRLDAATGNRTGVVEYGLWHPQGVAVDGAGNVYIADTGNNAVKEWNAASGSLTTLNIPWTGSPMSLAVDGAGNVYVADFGKNRIRELPRAFVDPTARCESDAAGSDTLRPVLPANANLTGPFAPVSSAPSWLTISGVNNGIVSFSFTATTNSRTASITVLGQTNSVTQLASYYLGATNVVEAPGAGTDSVVLAVISPTKTWSATANAPWLHLPAASGMGSTNLVFTFDANAGGTRTGTLSIGTRTLTVTQAGSTYVPATLVTNLVSSGLNQPQGVAVDGDGNVYIADFANSAIKKWTVATATVSLVTTTLTHTAGVAVDSVGNVFFTEYDLRALKKWNVADGSVSTLVASGLGRPAGLAMDLDGNLYIADDLSNTVWTCSSSGSNLTALVSSGLLRPYGVAVDEAGNVYIADSANAAIKRWNAANSNLTTLVSGVPRPSGIAVDGGGDVYFSDDSGAVKKWNAAGGAVTTLVLGLNHPYGLAVDGAANVYIADMANNAVKEQVRAFVDPSPQIEPFSAGSDSLPVVLPATENLSGPFTPTSDQPWLTLTGVTNGVVSFSFTATSTGRTGHISLLGQSISVTQPRSDIRVLGANQAAITNGEAASAAKGTDYGTQFVGSVWTQTFSITNPGTATLNLSNVTTTGAGAAQFAVAGMPSTVAMGTVSNFTIAYTAAYGLSVAIVSITSDATNTPYQINVRGTGIYPAPVVAITNTDATVTYDVTSYTVGGTNNASVAGTMNWTNSSTSATGSFAAASPWSVTGIALGVGTNVITVTGTNLSGQASADSVQITRGAAGTGVPLVNLTNVNATVTYDVSTCTIGGTNNANVVGTMRWTNSLTGVSGTFAAASPWSVAGIALGVGTNVITVTGTNLSSQLSLASVQITRGAAGTGVPVVSLTNVNATVTYDVSTYTIGGTNNANVVGTMRWTNALTAATGTFAAASPWSVAGIALGVGTNGITVAGTNLSGQASADSVQITRGAAGTGVPVVSLTNVNATVTYDVTSYTIGGTNNANVVGTMRWTNSLTGATGSFAAASPWTVAGIALGVGTNGITVTGTNLSSQASLASVQVTRGAAGTGLPVVSLTNVNATVTYDVSTYSIGGTNNANVVGTMRWTNSLTGVSGTFAAASPWSVAGIALGVGTNVITVTGTNLSSQASAASVQITRGAAGTGVPLVNLTNVNATVTYDVTSYTIGGTNNVNVVGTMRWTNALTGATGTFAAVSPWTVTGIALGVGTNGLTVTGTNLSSQASTASVQVTRGAAGTGVPVVSLTNVNATVTYDVSTYTIGGTNNANVVGTMRWTNSLTGVSGTFAAASRWSVAGIALGVGANAITVTGTNLSSQASAGSVQITRALNDWSVAAYRDTNFTASSTVISNAAQLAQFAFLVNSGINFIDKTVTLASDIDLSAHDWTAIGGSETEFDGTFEGAGKTIRGVRIHKPDADGQGLFGYAGIGATIRNLTVADADITGNNQVGGVVGCQRGTLQSCVAGGTVSGYSFVGGVAGSVFGGIITACTNTASVSGVAGIGGVTGVNTGDLANSVNSGAVSGGEYLGGLSGMNSGSVYNSDNSGSVGGTAGGPGGVGGIVGWTQAGMIINDHNRGAVAGGQAVGGVIGASQETQVANCFSQGSVSGTNQVGGLIGYMVSGDVNVSYWKRVAGSPGFDLPAAGEGSVGACESVGAAPGTLENPVAVEGRNWSPTVDLLTALNQQTVEWNSGYGISNMCYWAVTPGQNDGYPYLVANPWFTIACDTLFVPYSWLDSYYPGLSEPASYEAAANALGANGIPVWNSYLAGLTPTNASSKFLVTILPGLPPRIATTPSLPSRLYSLQFSTNLTNGWSSLSGQQRLPGGSPLVDRTTPLPATGFYRVLVELP